MVDLADAIVPVLLITTKKAIELQIVPCSNAPKTTDTDDILLFIRQLFQKAFLHGFITRLFDKRIEPLSHFRRIFVAQKMFH